MEKTFHEAILKTLYYADIFDYPLKEGELWRKIISPTQPIKGPAILRKSIKELYHLGLIGQKQGYYFLPNRGKIVALRRKRAKWSREKFVRARRISNLLKIIPTICMVGLTGSLAVENADREDDIDFLIVASAGTVWLTRLLTTVFLDVIGQRRRPGQKSVRDKICLNMYLDERNLQIPKEERDLYAAHEITQLKPLWERGNVYQKFVEDNLWIKDYLPNSLDTRILRYKQSLLLRNKDIKKKKARSILITQYLSIFERMAKQFQLWYMWERRTTEKVSDGSIRFHPQDARIWILKEYQKKISNCPLDR